MSLSYAVLILGELKVMYIMCICIYVWHSDTVLGWRLLTGFRCLFVTGGPGSGMFV